MSKLHRTVLAIDDSPESVAAYGQQLQQDATFSYRILTGRSERQILALCRSQHIDSILLELDSPRSSSLNFLVQLKKQMGDRCPPIVVIGNGNIELAVRAFKNGAADYLMKDRMTPEDLRLAMRDAIENAELRRELQRSQQQFQTSVENMLDCFGIFSAMRDESGQIIDFRIDYLNAAACENNRMPKEMQIGRGLCELLPGHCESGLFDKYCRLVKTGEPLVEDSLIYEDTYAGQRLVRAFDLRATKLNDGFVASWRDITNAKRLELKLNQTVTDLQQQQHRLQRLIDTAPIGIGIGTASGEVKKINDAMLHLHGLTREEFEQRGMNWRDFTPLDLSQRTDQAMKQLQQQGFSPPEEKELLRRDGTRIPIWIAAMQWMDGTDEHVAFAVDLTQQKQAEAEREQLLQREQAAREEAERANRIKDEFLAVLSHELRSPLNPILGWSKLLQTGKFDETTTAKALETIERNAKLQTQLIDDLLDLAKILRGKLNLNLTSVNLSFVIEAAIETVMTVALAKSISLHPVLPNIGQVSGDAARLQQIVWNLLSNAIKFTLPGGRVDIWLKRVDNQAEITVRDTGKGINPNFLPHIFKSFRQEDASIARKHGGLGLGLAIVHQLVEVHGGTIMADSPGEGLGATFTVRLPLLNVESQIEQTDQLSQAQLDLTGIRVLAVDDDPDTRELLTVLLTQYGAEVMSVASAAEVLANLEFFQPDVLVSDIGMPEVDGYTLIQRVRALPRDKGGQIPAIALSAYAREEDRRLALTHGFQRHISKPIESIQLVQAAIALVRN